MGFQGTLGHEFVGEIIEFGADTDMMDFQSAIESFQISTMHVIRVHGVSLSAESLPEPFGHRNLVAGWWDG